MVVPFQTEIVVQTLENRQLHKRKDEISALQHPFLQGSVCLNNATCTTTATALPQPEVRAVQEPASPPAHPLWLPWYGGTPSSSRHGWRKAAHQPTTDAASTCLPDEKQFAPAALPQGFPGWPSWATTMAEVIEKRPGPWTDSQVAQRAPAASPQRRQEATACLLARQGTWR